MMQVPPFPPLFLHGQVNRFASILLMHKLVSGSAGRIRTDRRMDSNYEGYKTDNDCEICR